MVNIMDLLILDITSAYILMHNKKCGIEFSLSYHHYIHASSVCIIEKINNTFFALIFLYV